MADLVMATGGTDPVPPRWRLAGTTSTNHFSVLGPVEVAVGDRRIDVGGPKSRVLLAALLANRNRPVSVERLAETLWGDEAPETAHKSLQKFVSGLRKQLGEGVVTRPPGYLIEVADDALDAARLEGLVREAQGGGGGWEVPLAGELSAWRGDPYPELVHTGWGMIESARLVELRLTAEELLAKRRVETGDPHQEVAHLEALVRQHPFHERFWSLLMTALYRSGRQASALDAYKRLQATLGNELGIEPSPELQRLEEQILLHDPALSAHSTPTPNNLPASVTSFVGRGQEIESITHLLHRTRLVTLLGPAGSGKSRLAVEVARSLLADSTWQGIWLVELAAIRSPDEVVEAIAKPLGTVRHADQPTEDVLIDHFARQRSLLILDNCEHLIARVAAVTDRFLKEAPSLVVLATSRERLGSDGETIFDVLPLPYPSTTEPNPEEFDAVRLFLARARAVSRGEQLGANPETVSEIVRRLDGMPLALELAAARVRTYGLTELRDRLDDRFQLLVSPSRTATDRHQTLQAAVDWSFRLLSEREQVLFRRLSVFRGGFDLRAAEVVCGFEPLAESKVADLVGSLVDKSLVSLSPPGTGKQRYFILETMKEFGQMLLDTSESGRLRQAHAEYFRSLAEEAARHLTGPEQKSWLAVLETDHDNFRKALRWGATAFPETAVRLAVALSRFWDSVGPRSEGLEWLRRAVELSGTLDPKLRIEALVQASDMFSSQHASLPREYAEMALAEARRIGSELGEAKALRALSWALTLDGRIDEACQVGLEAQRLFAERDDPWELALWMERMGQGSYADPDWSIGMLEQALALYRQVGDRSREALVLYKLADQISGRADHLGVALDYAAAAIAISEEVGNVHDGAHARLEYGRILRRIGDLAGAEAVLREALTQLTGQGDERCSIRTLTALGTTQIDAGDVAGAKQSLYESLERGTILGERRTARSALAGLARVLAAEGNAEDAVRLLGFVEELGLQLDIPVSERSQSKRDTYLSSLRDHLGEDAYTRLWDQGRKLTLAKAIDIGLGSMAKSAKT